jgi:ribosomal-protein-alanine N-acetyltransferase
MSFTTRDATPDDLATFVLIHEAVLQRGWNVAAFDSFYHSGQVIALLAEEDGNPAGFIFCWCIAEECELLNIGVLPPYQGQGIGRRLCDAAIAQARHSGMRQMHLEVSAENAPARQLYQSCGFEVVRRRAAYYRYPDGRSEDALTMLLPLK